MQLTRVRLRAFRSYHRATLPLGPHVTVITGANGAGKTNLLEALYFGCTGRSCRTTNEREVVAFGERTARVVVSVDSGGAEHEFAVGFTPGQPKLMAVDGTPVDRLLDHPLRPLVSVFLPDRLDLVKGAPAGRRSHLDQFVAAIWPARAGSRTAFGRALAQRNALLLRVRDGRSDASTLASWDRELALCAAELAADRHAALAEVAPLVPAIGKELGLADELTVRYRGTAEGSTPEAIEAGLRERRSSDIARGFTQSGPHRDDLVLEHGRREVRMFASQGQQRLALLALLIAEREVLAGQRDHVPLLLLDDVFSELDAERRGRLLDRVAGEGQVVITTTEIEHLPERARGDALHVAVENGVVEVVAGPVVA